MSGKRYMEEFKVAAVKQVVGRGHHAAEVAERFGVSIHSIYRHNPAHDIERGIGVIEVALLGIIRRWHIRDRLPLR